MLCGVEKEFLRCRILAVGVCAWLVLGIAEGCPSAGRARMSGCRLTYLLEARLGPGVCSVSWRCRCGWGRATATWNGTPERPGRKFGKWSSDRFLLLSGVGVKHPASHVLGQATR